MGQSTARQLSPLLINLWLGARLEPQRGSWKIILFEWCCLKWLQSGQGVWKGAEVSWNAVMELLLAFLCLEDGWKKSAPLKHSLGCSSGKMAVLVVGRGLWRPWCPPGSPAAAGPGPPAVRFGMSARNLLSFHISDCGCCTNSSAFGLAALLLFFFPSLIFVTFCHAPFDVKTASAQLQGCSLRRPRKMCCAHRIAQGLSISFLDGCSSTYSCK